MIVKLLTEHHLEFLSFKGGCRGSSESTHVKISNCWKSHTPAHIIFNRDCTVLFFSVVEELEHDIFDPIENVQEEKNAAILKHMPVRERWDSQMSRRAEVSVSGTEDIKPFYHAQLN